MGTETPTTQDKQVTVDVPADRLPEFYAFFAHFLAGEPRRRGRRRGPHGPGHGPGHRGHGCRPRHAEADAASATTPTPAPADDGEAPAAGSTPPAA